jgi:hypothetical protein
MKDFNERMWPKMQSKKLKIFFSVTVKTPERDGCDGF